MPESLSLQAGFVYNLAMRKVILGLGVSLDGYIARLDGSVDFLFMPKDYSMAPFFKTIDTAGMRRHASESRLQKDGAWGWGGFSGSFSIISRSPPGPQRV